MQIPYLSFRDMHSRSNVSNISIKANVHISGNRSVNQITLDPRNLDKTACTHLARIIKNDSLNLHWAASDHLAFSRKLVVWILFLEPPSYIYIQ